MKKIEIIPIAKKKSGRRGIPVEWIEETINYPDQIVEGYGGRKVAQKKYMIKDKEYLLRVVYEDKEEMNTVLTAYLTSQVVRYWKE
jgi:transcription elongation factor